ncbi:MAG: 4Fe-4S single cluster domain-containing protein [bacterium]
MNKDITIRIHSRLAKSYANGPGCRAVIWFQGCPFRCRDCYNQNIQPFDGGIEISVTELLRWLESIKDISGLTLSGGEPTEQMTGLLVFLYEIRKTTNLSILIFSGRTLEQVLSMPGGKEMLSLADVLIDALYEPQLSNPAGIWPSSSNQTIHFLTGRYSEEDFQGLPECEAIIDKNGDVIITGNFGDT